MVFFDDDDDDEDDDSVKVCWRYVFSWEKFKQQPSRGKTSAICNSMASFTAHCKKTSFMTGIPQR